MRMYLQDRKLQKIWMPSAECTLYPITQIPPGKMKLRNFAWFDYVRPVNPEDIFNWRGKARGSEMRILERHAAPLQKLSDFSENNQEPPPPSDTSQEMEEASQEEE